MKFNYKSKRIAILTSYVMIAVNTLTSILLVPIYIRYLGVDGYGFYQMIYSIASYILILDFGISTTMVRFITEYRSKNDSLAEENFAAHCLLLVGLISGVIIFIGLLICPFLGNIYPTLSPDKVIIGKQMFLYMIATLVFTIFEHYLEGIAIANEAFTVSKLLGTFKIVVKSIIIVFGLKGGAGVQFLAVADLISVAITFSIYLGFDFKILRYKIRFHGFNPQILQPMATFMFAIMLQSIVAYLNNTVDKTVLGIMLGETASGLYGVSMTFITMFNMIPTTILTLFLPTATKMVIQGKTMTEQTNMAIRIGRYQLIVCGGILCAFFVLGRDFIHLWAGTDEKMIWMIALIIMVPNIIPLVQNYCLNVLDALNKRLFRSVVLLGISCLNVVLTILMVRKYGVLGAPISTAISYLIGHGVVMNGYYSMKIKLEIGRMWKEICHGILPAIVMTCILTYPLCIWNTEGWLWFGIKCMIWIGVYATFTCVIGLNKHEKKSVLNEVKAKVGVVHK